MRCLQITEPGKFKIIELPVPKPSIGEVLVRVRAVTTCPQWDMHIFSGVPMFDPMEKINYPYTPGQPGHETTGEVVEVGEGVGEFSPGDHVAVWKAWGQELPGSYAEFFTLDKDKLILVPKDLDWPLVASMELAMCVGSVLNYLSSMGGVRHKRVGVSGLGPAGLIAVQLTKAEGATEVIGFDVNDERLAYARTLGADRTVNPRSEEGRDFPRRWESPEVEVAIDCSGVKESVEYIMDVTLETVALFGVQREDYPFTRRHWKSPGLRLCGYPGHFRQAAEYALDKIVSGELRLDRLITHTMEFEDYADGVRLLKEQKAVKVCFRPNG